MDDEQTERLIRVLEDIQETLNGIKGEVGWCAIFLLFLCLNTCSIAGHVH